MSNDRDESTRPGSGPTRIIVATEGQWYDHSPVVPPGAGTVNITTNRPRHRAAQTHEDPTALCHLAVVARPLMARNVGRTGAEDDHHAHEAAPACRP
jgi:hypothetical protein